MERGEWKRETEERCVKKWKKQSNQGLSLGKGDRNNCCEATGCVPSCQEVYSHQVVTKFRPRTLAHCGHHGTVYVTSLLSSYKNVFIWRGTIVLWRLRKPSVMSLNLYKRLENKVNKLWRHWMSTVQYQQHHDHIHQDFSFGLYSSGLPVFHTLLGIFVVYTWPTYAMSLNWYDRSARLTLCR